MLNPSARALPAHGVRVSSYRRLIAATDVDIMISVEICKAEPMAQLLVRNLDDDVKAQLRKRARQRGRSTEEEVREILRHAVRSKDVSVRALGTQLRARFARIGLDDDIAELRGHKAKPVRFGR